MSETSTEGVRDHFGGPPFDGIGGAGRQCRLAVFDRWLTAHDAEVKAEVLRDAYREWFLRDPILSRGYWLIRCDDCDGTGRFPVPYGYDGDASCVRCKATGTVPVCMADPEVKGAGRG